MVLPVDEAVKVWTAKLEGVFHTKATDDTSKVNSVSTMQRISMYARIKWLSYSIYSGIPWNKL